MAYISPKYHSHNRNKIIHYALLQPAMYTHSCLHFPGQKVNAVTSPGSVVSLSSSGCHTTQALCLSRAVLQQKAMLRTFNYHLHLYPKNLDTSEQTPWSWVSIAWDSFNGYHFSVSWISWTFSHQVARKWECISISEFDFPDFFGCRNVFFMS